MRKPRVIRPPVKGDSADKNDAASLFSRSPCHPLCDLDSFPGNLLFYFKGIFL